jgi:hypothetical protein
MLLFRYFGSHALETLQDNLLKAATISSLNDPFELLYRLAGTMTVAKYYAKQSKQLQELLDGNIALSLSILAAGGKK